MKRIYTFIFIPFFIFSCSKSIIKEQPTPQPKAETTLLRQADLNTLSKTVKPYKKNTNVAKKTVRKTKIQTAKIKKIKRKLIQKPAISAIKNRQAASTDTFQVKPATKLETLKPNTEPIEQTPEIKSTAMREDKLPMQFGSSWVLDKKQGYLSNKPQCLLSSIQKKFYDGYDNAKMSLQLSATALIIKTDSEIDLTYPEIGIYIDNNSAFLFDKIANKRYTLNRKNISELTALMKTGKQINIKLGFWPTWPQTKTSSITFSLQSFDKALAALKACNQL